MHAAAYTLSPYLPLLKSRRLSLSSSIAFTLSPESFGANAPIATINAAMIQFVLLISRQAKVGLTKWYWPYTQKERTKIFHPSGKTSHVIFDIMGCLIFCGYIVYDTDELIKRHQYDEYMLAAI